MNTLISIVVCPWLVAVSPSGAYERDVTYERAVLEDRPVGYWRFEEASPTQRAENLGSRETALAGTYIDVGLSTASASPSLGRAARFEHPTSAMQLAAGLDRWLNATATLEFWIKTTQTGEGSWNAPAVAGADSNGDGNDLFWGTNNGRHIGIRRGDSGPAALSARPLNDGAWHHVVITRDAATGVMLVYADGRLSPDAVYDDADGLQIATSYRSLGVVEHLPGGAQKLEASLDEVSVYDYVLSAEQVAEHFRAAGELEQFTVEERVLKLQSRVDRLAAELQELRRQIESLDAAAPH
jgi:hypothetical protein